MRSILMALSIIVVVVVTSSQIFAGAGGSTSNSDKSDEKKWQEQQQEPKLDFQKVSEEDDESWRRQTEQLKKLDNLLDVQESICTEVSRLNDPNCVVIERERRDAELEALYRVEDRYYLSTGAPVIGRTGNERQDIRNIGQIVAQQVANYVYNYVFTIPKAY